MKLAASQLAWAPEDEHTALGMLADYGFAGLEIAPTRFAGPTPYAHPEKAAGYAKAAQTGHGLALCSMQSIWYGQQGSIFGPERAALLDYTKAAIRFAQAGGIGNLVFGCPKNRVMPLGVVVEDALPFFKELGDYAHAHGTVLALEANPAIYNTNFINFTAEAFAFVRQANSPGLKVNLDVGTLLANAEPLSDIEGHVGMLNHVHVSEPHLAPVARRELHSQLAGLLRNENYAGFVSLEMQAQPMDVLQKTLAYMVGVFG
ncbi:MAG: sugar phosphate isomerase/epimerase [Ruminococcaceae bacterium]|nr:sugar phosphate isomerase/epimerase [Oscillospiraceae bacterium]